MGIELLLLIVSLLILISIGIAKIFDNLGVPSILLFIIVGMLAGSEGPGGLFFNDAWIAQTIGIFALIYILFSGGLDTNWNNVKVATAPAASLATAGVFITAVLLGLFVSYLLNISFLYGLLFGAIVSSTDAAAVFSILRSKNTNLKGSLRPLIELESGSNDPMAVFLTIGTIELIINPQTGAFDIGLFFIYQMGLGAFVGVFFGRLMVFFLNHLNFFYEGIYPVFAFAFAAFIYSVAAVFDGSGFLAVYIAGIIVGNHDFIQKKGLLRFFDGLAWLCQIAMFLTLGLLVFPSNVYSVLWIGLLVSAFLMFIARPVSVFITLSFFKFDWREKLFVSWVGLRGAIPIVLATYPLIYNLNESDLFFNIVFFVVLTSALLQGWSIPPVAKLLKVDAPLDKKKKIPIEFYPSKGEQTELVDFIIPYNSAIAGKPLVELGMPGDSIIVLITRNEESIVPGGSTTMEEGDAVLVLVNKGSLPKVNEIFSRVDIPGEKKPVQD